ncbi:hypothetical protein NYE54_32280 [Paenibacillus sp. FSL K6-1330]|uniref:hypothetical protein n=1 Tax=Paenibacillus sp. FSL K6-1330 TaxID=2975292 RepID=UPI0030D77DFC
MMLPTLIQAKGLRKTYGQRTVVHDVALDIREGEVLAIIGPNGMSIAVSPQADISGIWMPLMILAGFTVLILGAAAWTFRWDAEQPAGWKRAAAKKAASM